MSRRTHPAIKAAVAIALLAGIAVLFVRSLGDTNAEPFAVRASQLEAWTLVANEAADPDQPVLALAPPAELPMRLFRQVFSRAGESLSTPTRVGIALVLAAELRGVAIPVADLVEMAKDAGVGRDRLQPRCMGYRRQSQPGSTRQLYFVLFDMPEFASFREVVAARVASGGGARFAPGGLSPVMLLAGQPDVSGWLPVMANPEEDCMAPVEIE